CGNLLTHELRPLPAQPDRHPTTGLALSTPEFEAAVAVAMSAWKAALGFRPAPINVRRFSVPELGIGIEDLPGDLEDFLKAPEMEAGSDQEEMLESLRDWDESGSF